MAISPPALNKGDTVLLIATARKITRTEVEPVVEALQAWGFNVETGPSLFSDHHQFAGDDAVRAADLQWALDHPGASAVFIARGGYGTARIIDRVNFSGFEQRPKWICGYSDVTVLHSHLYRSGYRSLHCVMANGFFRHRESTLSVLASLSGQLQSFKLEAHPLNKTGNAQGDIIGGNLSVIYSLSGSPSEMNFRNKILFLEDIDEYLYHVDRMMVQLKRARKLEGLAGLVVGGFTDMKDNKVPFGSTAEAIIRDAVKDYDFPLAFGFPAGHQDLNLAFVHGARMTLTVKNSGATITPITTYNRN